MGGGKGRAASRSRHCCVDATRCCSSGLNAQKLEYSSASRKISAKVVEDLHLLTVSGIPRLAAVDCLPVILFRLACFRKYGPRDRVELSPSNRPQPRNFNLWKTTRGQASDRRCNKLATGSVADPFLDLDFPDIEKSCRLSTMCSVSPTQSWSLFSHQGLSAAPQSFRNVLRTSMSTNLEMLVWSLVWNVLHD